MGALRSGRENKMGEAPTTLCAIAFWHKRAVRLQFQRLLLARTELAAAQAAYAAGEFGAYRLVVRLGRDVDFLAADLRERRERLEAQGQNVIALLFGAA